MTVQLTVPNADRRAWLHEESLRLLDFPRAPFPPQGGSYWLADDGSPWTDRPVYTWITARMTYVYALAALERVPRAAERSDRALRGLLGPLRDDRFGGWFESTSPQGEHKSAYAHAFVVLAAAAGAAARLPGGEELLRDALDVVERRFWVEREGLSVDLISRDWSETAPYRGLNANMHLVEAYLAASELRRPHLLERAIRICRRVAGWASDAAWRVPEHYDEDWRPLPDFNRRTPRDPFKPFGAVPGHGFEWSRLMMQAAAGAPAEDRAWLLEAARALYARAREDGWRRGDAPGFVYSVDWQGRPVVEKHLFWVASEAASAADAFRGEAAPDGVDADLVEWWDHISRDYVDRVSGSWIHELDAHNRPSHTIWQGKPDLYHAYQACTFPRFEVSTSLLGSVMRAAH
jgi:mannose/cellobiose epimerase-like protein (N-acyl-D-glucosamine 2-epimerase family)